MAKNTITNGNELDNAPDEKKQLPGYDELVVKIDVTDFVGLLRKLRNHGFRQEEIESLISDCLFQGCVKNDLFEVIQRHTMKVVKRVRRLNQKCEDCGSSDTFVATCHIEDEYGRPKEVEGIYCEKCGTVGFIEDDDER